MRNENSVRRTIQNDRSETQSAVKTMIRSNAINFQSIVEDYKQLEKDFNLGDADQIKQLFAVVKTAKGKKCKLRQ